MSVDFGVLSPGDQRAFVVVGITNKGNTVAPPLPITVTLTNDSDPATGSASVAPDGSGGLLTAGTTEGSGAFHVDGGGFTDDATYQVSVAEVLVGIQIQPLVALSIKPKVGVKK